MESLPGIDPATQLGRLSPVGHVSPELSGDAV